LEEEEEEEEGEEEIVKMLRASERDPLQCQRG
jgi:hypothetical protein